MCIRTGSSPGSSITDCGTDPADAKRGDGARSRVVSVAERQKKWSTVHVEMRWGRRGLGSMGSGDWREDCASAGGGSGEERL
jgi:hypothetical protein